jgi:hypothetical protein
MLAELVTAEGVERKPRSIRYQMTAAKFPLAKDLVGFDFASSPVNEMTVRDLHDGHFMEAARSVVFVGRPAAGSWRGDCRSASRPTPRSKRWRRRSPSTVCRRS